MTISDDMRREMLREVLDLNTAAVLRPGDLTATDVMEAVKAEGGGLSRSQAYRWLDKMVETHGWEIGFVLKNGRRTKIWRKPPNE